MTKHEYLIMASKRKVGRLTPPKIQRGVMMLEVLAALMIVMLASIYASERYQTYLEEQSWQVAAAQATAFNNAAKSYIADNTDTILNGTLPFKVTPSLLSQNGYLDKGFSVSSYGQSYVTSIVKNSKLTSKLQALTCSTGGERISYKGLRTVAAQIQGMGGYVDDSGTATGAYGGWTSNPTDFGISCENGHLAIALSSEVLGTALQESDRLYRYKMNAKPDLNRMHTDIDMGNNNINSVATLNGQIGMFSGNVNAANIVASGDISANGNIRSNTGWLISKHGKGWLNEDHGGGLYMDDSDWLKSVNGKGIYTSGELKGGRVTSDGRLTAGEYIQLNGLAVAGNSCSPDGLLGRNSTGGILSCQSGVWRDVGKNSGSYVSLGSYTQQYNGRNDGDTTLQVSVSGGASTRNKEVKEGGCVNTWALDAIVNGFTVVSARDNNVSWAKSGFITFAVPAKTNYTIISDPNPTEGCSPGVFSVVGYQ